MAACDEVQPLIPGLDEEVALVCLARVPRAYHKTVRSVCKSWKRLLDLPESTACSMPVLPVTDGALGEDVSQFLSDQGEVGLFEDVSQSLSGRSCDGQVMVEKGSLYSMRKAQGLSETWVYLRTRSSMFINRWRYFDVTNSVWSTPLPQIPYITAAMADRKWQPGAEKDSSMRDMNKVRGLGSAAVGPKVYVFGGWREGGPALQDMFCYDAVTERWTRKARMLTPRCYMAAAAVGHKIYVAGGMTRPRLHQSELLVSAEVYDTERDTWQALPDMPFAMFFSCAVAMEGQVYVSGSRPPQDSAPMDVGPSGRGCILDPSNGVWRPLCEKRLGEVMLSPCTSVGEWLFVASPSAIQAWNSRTEQWHTLPVLAIQREASSPSAQSPVHARYSGMKWSVDGRAVDALGCTVHKGNDWAQGTSQVLKNDHVQHLLSGAMKECVFMGRLDVEHTCRLALLLRSGAITSVDVEFWEPQRIAIVVKALEGKGFCGSSTSSSRESLYLEAMDALNLRCRYGRADSVKQVLLPVIVEVSSLSVGPPLEDEQPVDMALVTL